MVHHAKRVFGTALYGAAVGGFAWLGVQAAPHINETPHWAEASRALTNLSGYQAAPLFGLGDGGHSLAPTSFVSADLNWDSHRIQEIECIAMNIYHEARGESVDGMRAVGHVVMNRARDRAFPGTACDVIRQGGREITNLCQFSWWCDELSNQPLNRDSWAASREIAAEVYDTPESDVTMGALFYHADYVKPFWRTSMVKGPKIGQHIFYSKPGSRPAPVQVAKRDSGEDAAPRGKAPIPSVKPAISLESIAPASGGRESRETKNDGSEEGLDPGDSTAGQSNPTGFTPVIRRGLDGRPIPPQVGDLMLRQPSQSRRDAGAS